MTSTDMGLPPEQGGLSPAGPAVRTRSLFSVIIAALGTMILILPQIWITVAASIWGLDGLLHLPLAADIVLACLLVPPALWASWKTITLSLKSERGLAE